MGVLNVNFDSFYGASRIASKNDYLPRIEGMLKDGMDLLDLGAYSSRPGADFVDFEEERKRLNQVLISVRKEFPDLIISVDTFRSEIARFSIDQGANIINDISGGELDEQMFETIADLDIPYIMMHMKGNPQNMMKMTNYDDILKEIFQFFDKKLQKLDNFGVKDVVIDLGYGFSKTLDQNYFLLNHQEYFSHLNRPILAGLSRKSMIYKFLDIDAEHALNGTSVLNFKALQNGAKILRVHDVKEAVEVRELYLKLVESK
jgi:dihydropteroate synthase